MHVGLIASSFSNPGALVFTQKVQEAEEEEDYFRLDIKVGSALISAAAVCG